MSVETFATQLLAARERVDTIARPSAASTTFNLEAAYAQASLLTELLGTRGWRPVGRKLGFTNRATWDEFDLSTPIWANIYDQTITHTSTGSYEFSLANCVAPRIEPEIVLGLNTKIAEVSTETQSLSTAIDWIAPGFEIVDCHYLDWEFNAADIVADFGAHAHLIIGEKHLLDADSRIKLDENLSAAEVVLKCDHAIVDRGVGANALDGPLAALANLHSTLAQQKSAGPLRANEIITTGTLTSIPFVAPGQEWSAAFTGAGLANLTLKLI